MIAWALHCAGVQYQLHYLDDCLFMAAPDMQEGQQLLDLASRTLQHLGVPVAFHKTEGPATVVTFLGILIDTQSFELRLSMEKLQRLQALVTAWLDKRACKKKELESLLGHLSHAASIIRPGRIFLRSLFNLLHVVRAPSHFVRLTAGARADLAWWRCFLQHWNGSSFFPLQFMCTQMPQEPLAAGRVSNQLGWFQAQWPTEWEDIDISVKELVPVVAAAALWGKRWASQHIRFHSDNRTVVAVLNTRTAKSPPLMHLLRCFSFIAPISDSKLSMYLGC